MIIIVTIITIFIAMVVSLAAVLLGVTQRSGTWRDIQKTAAWETIAMVIIMIIITIIL